MPGTGKPVNICMGSTMDNQLIRELFGNTMAAAKILAMDDSLINQLAGASAKLPPNRIGSDGRLMEWLEEYEEEDPHHRHTSHLYGLHRGTRSPRNKPPNWRKPPANPWNAVATGVPDGHAPGKSTSGHASTTETTPSPS